MRYVLGFSLLLWVAIAGAQTNVPDTYDRLFALRDSLRAWAVGPPPDTAATPERMIFSDYFPGAEFSTDSPGSLTLTFSPLMEMNWGGLRGIPDSTCMEWNVLETSLSAIEAERLAWLRTLPLPPAVRAASLSLPDTITWVLHGRDIDRIAMPAENAVAVLAWMARGHQLLAATLGNGTGQVGKTGAGSPQEGPTTGAETQDSGENAGFELFVLITAPGAKGHHAMRWREKHGQKSGESVIIHLYPFIPTWNVSELFAKPDTSRREHDPIPVGPGVRKEKKNE